MSDEVTFLIHPDTSVVYTVKEAADILKMTTIGLYGRIWRGETGHQLWRAKGAPLKGIKGAEKSRNQFVKCEERDKYIE